MIIKKKIWPEFFREILKRNKKFELRLADFDVKKGDILLLEEWDPHKKEYTGRSIKKKVKYLLKTKNIKFWSKKDIEKYGFVIISFD